MGPQPLGPITNPLVLVSIRDQHSTVGLVGQKRPSPGLLIDLVESEQNASFKRKALG